MNTVSDSPIRDPRRRSRALTAACWALVLLWAAFIFFMSAHPGSDLEPSGLFGAIIVALADIQRTLFGADLGLATPFLHFCEYALLSAFLTIALARTLTLARAATLATLLTSLYGATDEWHQWFVPGRACDPLDWIVDTLGAACAALICYIGLTRLRK